MDEISSKNYKHRTVQLIQGDFNVSIHGTKWTKFPPKLVKLVDLNPWDFVYMCVCVLGNNYERASKFQGSCPHIEHDTWCKEDTIGLERLTSCELKWGPEHHVILHAASKRQSLVNFEALALILSMTPSVKPRPLDYSAWPHGQNWIGDLQKWWHITCSVLMIVAVTEWDNVRGYAHTHTHTLTEWIVGIVSNKNILLHNTILQLVCFSFFHYSIKGEQFCRW